MTTVIPARPTTYNGIQMRSRLEARFAAFLDGTGLEWEYEPRAFASGRHQYLPDFVVRNHTPRGGSLYIEIKGTDRGEPLMARMDLILASEPFASLALIVADEISPGLLSFPFRPPMLPWTLGGVCICRCGRPSFWAMRRNVPSPFCHGGFRGYLNPLLP